MRRSFGALGAFLSLISIAVPAIAEIWVWQDRAGVSHYTTSLEHVPAAHRKAALIVVKDWERAELPPEPEPAPSPSVLPLPMPSPVPLPEADEHRARERRLFEGPSGAQYLGAAAPPQPLFRP